MRYDYRPINLIKMKGMIEGGYVIDMSTNVRFIGVNVGTKFKAFGIEFLKIRDVQTRGKKLSQCPANAINLSNGHECVLGDKVQCEIIE